MTEWRRAKPLAFWVDDLLCLCGRNGGKPAQRKSDDQDGFKTG